MRSAIDIDIDMVNLYLMYSESSESGLIVTRNWSTHGNADTTIGRVFGVKVFRRNGSPHCWKSTVNGVKLSNHRIIATMFYGKILEGKVVDHIDGNPFNNKLSNLRIVTQMENARNAKKRSSNKTGTTGVCEHIVNDEIKYIVGTVCTSRGVDRKYFSLKDYSYSDALRLACEWRNSHLSANNIILSERHGK